MEEKVRVVAAVIHHENNEVEIIIEKTTITEVAPSAERQSLSGPVEELLALKTRRPIFEEKATLHAMWVDCDEFAKNGI